MSADFFKVRRFAPGEVEPKKESAGLIASALFLMSDTSGCPYVSQRRLVSRDFPSRDRYF
jgi:hypothetical protein